MSEIPAENMKSASMEADPQPLALRELLRAMNAARRQTSLYGSDHPSIRETLDGLGNVISTFLECFGPSTFVVTEEAIILNDLWFKACNDSRELFRRLRSRGAMAFSMVGETSSNQVLEFLLYLNAEPQQIRLQGGSNLYLRKHGVTRIVVVDAIYSSDDPEEHGDPEAPAMDRAVSAVVTWLTRQDDDEDLPRFRTADIFADPDAAARLIHEAVTKLQAANRSKRPSELADKVVSDLKDLASTHHEDWDESTPKIRKAISKLPRDMRPALGGFSSCDQDIQEEGSASRGVADTTEVESAVNEFLEATGDLGQGDHGAMLPDIERLFGASSGGLLSNWKCELQPPMTMRSSARTLSALIAWETNSAEHGEITRSQAALVAACLEADQPQLALESAASLADEILQIGRPPWRAANAMAALRTMDGSALTALIEYSLKSGDQRAQEIAGALVEALPELALSVMENLRDRSSSLFMKHLTEGIRKSGRAAGPVLGQMMKDRSPTNRWTALEMLISIRTDWALMEIDAGLADTDPAFLARALEAISPLRSPLMTRICLANLRHRSSMVRCAALGALGSTGDASVIPELVRRVDRVSYRAYHLDEKTAAVRSLGRLGDPMLITWLERITSSRSLLWRAKHRLLRAAAAQAVEEIRDRQAEHRQAA